MIKMVSSRVKTASGAYDAMRRIGESVKRANPKDKWESASSVEKTENISELQKVPRSDRNLHRT